MTIQEAITMIDDKVPNTYSQSDKIKWLSELDEMVKTNVIDTHIDTDGIEFNGYNDATSLDTELIVKNPYTEVYILWMESKINYYNAEYGKYNQTITRYNDVLQAFKSEYYRKHMPKATRIKYF